LATHGYLLALRPDAVSQEQREEWATALDRLAGRKPFADREFFAYRPFEVLGIALGISCVAAAAPKRDWLFEILLRVLREREGDCWTQYLGALTGWVMGKASTPKTPALPRQMPLDELALIRWLIRAYPTFAHEAGF